MSLRKILTTEAVIGLIIIAIIVLRLVSTGFFSVLAPLSPAVPLFIAVIVGAIMAVTAAVYGLARRDPAYGNRRNLIIALVFIGFVAVFFLLTVAGYLY